MRGELVGFAAVGGLGDDGDVGLEESRAARAPRSMVWSSAMRTLMDFVALTRFPQGLKPEGMGEGNGGAEAPPLRRRD